MKNHHFHLSSKNNIFIFNWERPKEKDDIKCSQQCDEAMLAGRVIGKAFEKSNLAVSVKNVQLSVF